ncbi:MAG: hypothetical protein KDK70_18580, partial [Myxococcales bacterium]|nr:hypothetical protein [Myxococcales bacterium]
MGLLLGACDRVDGADDEEPWLEPRATVVPPQLQDAFWAVATLDDPTLPCPDLVAQSWAAEGTRMFVDATLGLAEQETDPVDLPDPLRGFCLYRWVGATGAPVLPVDPVIRHVSLDWAVVERLDNGLQSAYRPALRDVFMAQAGRVSGQAPQPTYPVMVGVVDSEPERAEDEPYIEHASSMVQIIEALACPFKQSCTVHPYRALALPLLETGAVRHDGGYYGARAHVAMGIVEAVLAWRKSVGEGDVSRLVINLSLGWVTDGGVGCGQGEDEPWCEAGGMSHADELHAWLNTPGPLAYSGQVANEAVHAALLYATCQGALVVAAAGNAKDDSCNEQPVAPAAWSRYASPSDAECAQLGFSAPAELGTWAVYDTDRPLLQPISAVDHGDAPIFLSRPGSETRLVGPGHMATVGDGMEPLTGTSISAAVATAGAALAWSYDPEPSAGAVMDRLYATATSLGRTSQLPESSWGAGADVRRISLCHAVDPACSGEGECGEEFCDPEGSVVQALTALRSEVDQQTGQLTPVMTTPT